MSWDAVEKIANAVLHEGYMLYPYRASAVKNRQRFNFGVLHPRAYCELQSGAEAHEMRTELLIEGPLSASVEVKTRFLQMIDRGGWQEGVAREVNLNAPTLESLIENPQITRFSFDGAIDGEARLSAARVEATFKLSLMVRNLVDLDAADMSREAILLQSMVSVHSILRSESGGQFVSALDPPEHLKEAAAGCNNVGAWPVLAGEEGCRDLMLASPIILYDYPQIAPESPGDLCDGTEIDEILALRILTMTDEEKAEIRSGDARAREILESTEMLPAEHFRKLHGALRGLRPIPAEARDE